MSGLATPSTTCEKKCSIPRHVLLGMEQKAGDESREEAASAERGGRREADDRYGEEIDLIGAVERSLPALHGGEQPEHQPAQKAEERAVSGLLGEEARRLVRRQRAIGGCDRQPGERKLQEHRRQQRAGDVVERAFGDDEILRRPPPEAQRL